MTDHHISVLKFELDYYIKRFRDLTIERAHRMKTNYEKVREFTEAMGQTLDEWPPTHKTKSLRSNLIYEESDEIDAELYFTKKINKAAVAKELADLLYVTYGAAAAFGIDIDKVFAEVHKSNMSKLDSEGKPVYRKDGKVTKGPNYKPPDLTNIVT